MKQLIASMAIIGLLSPSLSFAEDDFIFDPNYLLSDTEMTDSSTMTVQQIDAFLQRGALSGTFFETVAGNQATAAQIIHDASTEFELNPQFLLALLQREQSLVEDDSPTQRQLDWAMGYAVCDDCSKEDPRIQKFKGLGKQIYYAAQRIRTNYLDDLERRGFTETGLGPQRDATIDNTILINPKTALVGVPSGAVNKGSA